uniref:Immunoglobulin V-set domain-containing protein n=1 Tax=Maylandia zebra TaxID=106582 RepID=A0A3P9DML7_9CICH
TTVKLISVQIKHLPVTSTFLESQINEDNILKDKRQTAYCRHTFWLFIEKVTKSFSQVQNNFILFKNKRFYENYQHPSFHGRVKLRDPEMKDGDVSLILKNVAFNDTGMYECHIAVRNPVRSKRVHTEISLFINLTVTGEFVELIKCKLTTSSALYDPVRTLSTCDLISVYSAGETHESVLEKTVMEKGGADGNMDDAERVGSPSLQVVVPVAVFVALVAVAFGVHRKTHQHKKQHPVKLPTEDSSEVCPQHVSSKYRESVGRERETIGISCFSESESEWVLLPNVEQVYNIRKLLRCFSANILSYNAQIDIKIRIRIKSAA